MPPVPPVPPVTVDTNWMYNDVRTVVIENEKLRVIVMPDLGAKIWQITFKPRGKDFLWQHPRIKPRKVGLHTNYDDHFFGGWDELYPNDMAESINEEMLPDHGEIWTLQWQYAIERADDEAVTLHMWVETPITASRLSKRITLRAGESKLRFQHTITNLGRRPQPYLWKLHAAMAADEHSRIDLPARNMMVEGFGSPRTGRTNFTYEWPFAEDDQGGKHDMRQALSSESGVSEFQYATDMKAGWCALTHTLEGIGFGLSYDNEVLPSCWLFASYGGWRELQTVVLEPCTGYPVGLQDGIDRGTHRILEPRETVSCSIVASIYEGLSAVDNIDADGDVTGTAFVPSLGN
ncbi:uncharacterized protein DUF5107 [Paenibacillus taihuensis]|uniref:Uncharacterized protein DUF5107 n=1 Tax=Paenibacillus taihuensis TaxID=1156355 RepID=A0A3D9Q3M2_9BACL|nr:DUF4432 family protein [Paenibacillus taihuensis]REE57445.1 uncharacterized protein DUF5107 [Paenibacillus taihuensis]